VRWGGQAVGEDMSRGEMTRRLDGCSRQMLEQLNGGSLTAGERDGLAASLVRLLSIVADSLQDQEDREAVASLLVDAGRAQRGRSSFTSPVGRQTSPVGRHTSAPTIT
jgi:hypothetical protein